MKKRIIQGSDFIDIFSDLEMGECYFKEVYVSSPKFYEKDKIVNDTSKLDLSIRIIGLNENMKAMEIILVFENAMSFALDNSYELEVLVYSLADNQIHISLNGGINEIKSDRLFFTKKEILDTDSKMTKWIIGK